MRSEAQAKLFAKGRRRCTRCKKPKPLSDFGTHRNSYHSWCKLCQAEDQRQRRASDPGKAREIAKRYRVKWIRKVKELIEEAKNKPCADCGQRFPPCVMDFDHVDPSLKKICVGRMMHQTWSVESIKAEMAKCEVVCSNCHRIRTWIKGRRRRPNGPNTKD